MDKVGSMKVAHNQLIVLGISQDEIDIAVFQSILKEMVILLKFNLERVNYSKMKKAM
jgi:hypothetical protein